MWLVIHLQVNTVFTNVNNIHKEIKEQKIKFGGKNSTDNNVRFMGYLAFGTH